MVKKISYSMSQNEFVPTGQTFNNPVIFKVKLVRVIEEMVWLKPGPDFNQKPYP